MFYNGSMVYTISHGNIRENHLRFSLSLTPGLSKTFESAVVISQFSLRRSFFCMDFFLNA